MIIAPRFDSPLQSVLNVVSIAVLAYVLVVVFRRRKAGTGPQGWWWFAIAAHFSIAGVYLPVGPLWWLIAKWNQKPPPSGNGKMIG